MSHITESTCWKIQDPLHQGRCFTRQAWIDHPEFAGLHPRLAVIYDYSAPSTRGEYSARYVQVWDGRPGSSALNIYPYRPSDEDYRATDWLEVDREGRLLTVAPDERVEAFRQLCVSTLVNMKTESNNSLFRSALVIAASTIRDLPENPPSKEKS